MKSAWSHAKRIAFEESFYAFLDCVTISSKDYGQIRLGEHVYNAQRRLFTAIFDGLEEDIHDFYCLKSRQLGCSTAARVLTVFWAGAHDGLRGAMVFDTDENKQAARREIEEAIDNLPPKLRFPPIQARNRNALVLKNNSVIYFRSAGMSPTRASGALGASLALSFAHLCMAPGTLVIVADGKVKRIEDVVIGDQVLTHTGKNATVVANIGRPCYKPMCRITPWLGIAVTCSLDHKLATHRGLVEAGDLRARDWLVLPVRQITDGVKQIRLEKTPNRPQGGGAVSIGSEATVEINEEFGFFCGYFLAEGTILFHGRGEEYGAGPSGIAFSRHREEGRYSQRAIRAVSTYAKFTRTDDLPNSFASQDFIYGSALAAWVHTTFGHAADKHIPDEIFDYGPRFCTGLLAGLISGDGSKGICFTQGYELNHVNLVTTRSSIGFQARDIAASLGMGWASIRYSEAGVKYGRNCQATWALDWNGEAAARLRQLIGLEVVRSRSGHIEKYKIEDSVVYIQIRKIEYGIRSDYMFDLSVDHPDHTFRTPGMSVSNSEMCSWANAQGVEAFRHTLSEINPDRLYLWESTARGRNLWHEIWTDARADSTHKCCIFIGWWAKETQRLDRGDPDFDRYGSQAPSEVERAKIVEVKQKYGHTVTPEQLAWYRRTMNPAATAEGDTPVEFEGDISRRQEVAFTEEDTFLMTGAVFFDPLALTIQAQRFVSDKFSSYTFEPHDEFYQTRWYPAPNPRSIHLKVWEEPADGHVYIVATDPAYGTSETNDRCSIQVLDAYADCLVQVAEFATPNFNSKQIAWAIGALLGWYGGTTNSEVYHILELNGSGEAVWIELQSLARYMNQGYLLAPMQERGIGNVFQNVRNYIYTRSDAMSPGRSWQWQTNSRRKVTMMELLRSMITNRQIELRSQAALDEANSITREGDTIEATGSKKDDRVIALALGGKYWEQHIRRVLVGLDRTRANEEAKRRRNWGDLTKLFHDNHLKSFFAVKVATRNKAVSAARYRAWRGR